MRLTDLAHDARYSWRRNRWMLRPDLLWWRDLGAIRIDRPVFFTGLQGGGLTVVTRMLRRLPGVVTVSGDHRYWSGADEMHVTYGQWLPPSYRLDRPGPPPFGDHMGWAYACDALIGTYGLGEGDVVETDARRFRRAIQVAIALNAHHPRPRFFDKSQSYAVKIPFLRRSLEGCAPRFIGGLRNPWAACWRAAVGSDLRLVNLPLDRRVELAAEHWRNTAEAFVAETGRDDFIVLRIEDVLVDLEVQIQRLVAFADLEWDPVVFPSEGDRLPLGTRRRGRWYPVRPDINRRWLDQPDSARAAIGRVVGDLADRFGYTPEGEVALPG